MSYCISTAGTDSTMPPMDYCPPVPPDRYGIIYVVTHRETGKQYIGQTVTTKETRWGSHKGTARRGVKHMPYVASAIAKHGPEAFDVETLDWAMTKDELDRKERFWIAFLDTMAPAGYNLAEGGANGRHHPDSIARQAAKMKGRTPPNKGKPMSPAQIEKNRANALARFAAGWVHPMLGRTQTKEARAKISEAVSGPRPNRRKAIRCVETGIEYESPSDATKTLRPMGIMVSRSSLCHALKSPSATAGNCHWVYVNLSASLTKIDKPKVTRTPEERAAHSERMKAKYASGEFVGRRGKTQPSISRPVVCVETGEVYRTRNAAGRAMSGRTDDSVGSRIAEAIKTGGMAYGYYWRDATPEDKEVV